MACFRFVSACCANFVVLQPVLVVLILLCCVLFPFVLRLVSVVKILTGRRSLQEEDAYRKRDKVLYKQAKYTLEKEIRVAKRNYSKKLRIQLSSSDSASVWKGMNEITSYKIPSPSTVEN